MKTYASKKSQYPDGFFLVYIVNIDDHECLSPDRIPSRTNQTKELTFKIQKTVIASLLINSLNLIIHQNVECLLE